MNLDSLPEKTWESDKSSDFQGIFGHLSVLIAVAKTVGYDIIKHWICLILDEEIFILSCLGKGLALVR